MNTYIVTALIIDRRDEYYGCILTWDGTEFRPDTSEAEIFHKRREAADVAVNQQRGSWHHMRVKAVKFS